MKKRNLVGIICALLVYGQKLNCIDIFKPIVSFTALSSPLESFTPIHHYNKRLMHLNARPLEKNTRDQISYSDYTYQDFSKALLTVKKAINNGEEREFIQLTLETKLAIAEMNIDLRPEDKLKTALLFLANKNNETAINMIKAIVTPPATQDLSWNEHLKWICTQLESLRTLSSFKEEHPFIKTTLDNMQHVSSLTSRDRLNLARLYMVIEDKKSALNILENLNMSHSSDLIKDEVDAILKEFEKKGTSGT